MSAKVGDVIEIQSRKVGEPPRRGRVTEVVTTDPLELRVRWSEDHEPVIFRAAGCWGWWRAARDRATLPDPG